MTEDERREPQTISREDLYCQVWETPASRLCARYGISGRGLKKICDRLDIPSPPRGYWAQLAAGQRIKQTPSLIHLPARRSRSPSRRRRPLRRPQPRRDSIRRLPKG